MNGGDSGRLFYFAANGILRRARGTTYYDERGKGKIFGDLMDAI